MSSSIPKSAIAGVVLAGGQGRRLGGVDKALIELGGQSLVERVTLRLAPQVERLAINANGEPERFDPLGYPVISDREFDDVGPMAGVTSALDWADDLGFDWVATAAVDTPFFPLDLVARLSEIEGDKVRMAATALSGLHPTFALWPTSIRREMRDMVQQGARRVRKVAEEFGVEVVPFAEQTPPPFFNVNTQEDLDLARPIVADINGD